MGLLTNQENRKRIASYSSEVSFPLLDALRNDEYTIYLKKEDSSIIFVAFNKLLNSNSQNILFLHTNLNGEMIINQNNLDYGDSIILLKYLMEKEEEALKNGNDALKNLYLPLGESFVEDLYLDEKTRHKKLRAREYFLDFVSRQELSSLQEKEVEEKYQVVYSFSTSYEYFKRNGEDGIILGITVLLNNGRKRTIQKVSYFLDSFVSGAKYNQGGLDIYTSEKYYTEKDYEILTFFAKRRKSNYYDTSLLPSDFGTFLLLYKGNNIIFDNKNVHIDDEMIEEEFSLDENGNIIFPKFQYYITYNSYIIEFTVTNIRIHKFKDPLLARLTSYLAKKDDRELSFIKDLVIKEAKRSKNFRINSTEGYSIALYVDMIDNRFLSFDTKYIYKEEEINKETFLENANNALIFEHFKEELDKICALESGLEKEEGRVLKFLSSEYDDLSRFTKLYFSSKLKSLKQSNVPTISVQVKYDNDFLSLDFDMEDFTKEEMEEILKAYRHKRKFYLVHNHMVKLPEQYDIIDSLLEFSSDYDISISEIKEGNLPRYAYFSLASLEGNDFKIKKDKFIDEFIDKMMNYDSVNLSLTPAINEKMRPYQEKGIKWLKTLYELKLGAILADDMGLGKSLQTVGLISEISSDKPILIICPKSVTYNWAKEIEIWSSKEKVEVLTDAKEIRESKIKKIKNDKRIIYITSYDSLRNDLELYNEKDFSLLVADEAQFIKNAYAKKAQAIKSINADFKLALTGTPIENSLADLWSIFDFIMKGYLSNFENFKRKYITDDTKLETLRKKVSPFILRRVKKDVLKDLPKKEVLVQTLSMNEEERKLYDVTLKDARRKLEIADSSFSMFPVLTSLREICVDPMMFYEGIKETSTKFEFVLEMVKEGILSHHKFLIFSAFSSVLHHLEKVLKENEISNYLIDGQVSADDRITFASDFNENDEINVMLVSLKAGGTGLNLHGADIVIHLDPWWNFASEEQATDRAHRIGQKRPVTVYKLIMHNSIEEKVMKLQELKKELNSAVIAIDQDTAKKITKEDIKFLLS